MFFCFFYFFFFQAEDGIRDIGVTGAQTCALPIWVPLPQVEQQAAPVTLLNVDAGGAMSTPASAPKRQIGRASCRERV